MAKSFPVLPIETTTHSKKKIINLQGKKMIDTNGGFLLEDDPPAQKILPEEDFTLESRTCLECAKEFISSYLLTHFDYPVCDGCKDSEEKHSLITRTEAKCEYLLKDVDLDKREPPLKFINRKNPHNSNWGEMKLYLHLQVEQRAIEVWGSLDKIKAALNSREEKRVKTKSKMYNKKLKALRMAVRSSLYNKTSSSGTHVHEYGEESYNEEEDNYSRTCEKCGFVEMFEKL
ncbi:DNA repair protein complementing XP-A cells homolog Xpac [Rhodnius prolixus]|uniref:XPA_C domain-containing protein n=2 Tax=Rhodnius TaxID=13248 RepID=T1HHV3_RHOPR